jgi:2-phosphosulfolactate phosphatase
MASVWTDTHGQELVALPGLVSISEIGSRLRGSSLAFAGRRVGGSAGRQVARRQTGGMFAAHQQTRHSLRFDWALQGADAIALDADVAVVIDVLSFTTTLTVALDGGTTVLPYRWNDSNAANFARQHDAVLAVGRSKAEAGQISLSPATLRTARPPERLVLPSPNGSTIAHHLSERAHTVLGASLRNASAVAQWISDHHDPATSRVAVIAAGERWPDDSLRPGVEDLWGAGALIAALRVRGWTSYSPEAQTAAAAWTSVAAEAVAALSDCASGRELIDLGYDHDVAIAAEVDQSGTVPLLHEHQFQDARITNGSTRRRRQLEEPSAIETLLDSKAAEAGSGIDATPQ